MSSKRIINGLILICIMCFLSMTGLVQAQALDKSINPFEIKIEVERDIFPGKYVSLDITKVAGSEDMHGFDFLIGYDTSALSFVEAVGGELYDTWGDYIWEHFEYQLETPVSCDSGWCPSGLIRAIGIADINNGDYHHLDLSPDDGTRMFELVFRVTEDPAYDCIFTPVRFFWIDCGDNGLAVDMPPTIGLAVSDGVYDWDGYYNEIDDPDYGFPGYFGAPDVCLMDSLATIRFVDFYNGGVEIICSDSIDQRGDININGIAYEIADQVMFTNYFIFGLKTFGRHIEASIAASDVNADGVALSVEDLIYHHRVVCGDAPPYPAPPAEKTARDSLIIIQDLSTKTVSFEYTDTLAAMYLIFEGDITPEFLFDTQIYWGNYFSDGEYTYVLIQPPIALDPESPDACGTGFTEGSLFTYRGHGRLVQYGDDYRITGAADFNNNFFSMFMSSTTELRIIGGHDGHTSIAPQPLPKSLARISESETISLIVSDFTAHTVLDIDQASVIVNDSIVPLSTTILPPPPGFEDELLEIVVSARDFIDDYVCGPDTAWGLHPMAEYLDTLSVWQYVYSVTGQFSDVTEFNTLGDVTIIKEPVTIPVPSGWTTIGAAVEAAESHDTVEVAAGTYYEHDIQMKSGICLRSETGLADCVTINADSLGRVMIIENVGRSTSITGFTFTGGFVSGGPPDYRGGGVYCYSASPTFSNCDFSRNIAGVGGGMCCNYGSIPALNKCVFSENEVTDGGGGMACLGGSHAELNDCIFRDNSALSVGGGMVGFMSSIPTLTGCLFAGNSADGAGGGLYYVGFMADWTLILKECTFVDNVCPGDGAALSFWFSSPHLENCLIAYNGPGETIFCDEASLSYTLLTCCDMYGNAGGDWTGCTADQNGVNGNISLDPMFCDTANDNFYLNGLSPCVRYNNSCNETIGALAAACGFVCGDVSGDFGIDVGDAVYLIAYLFRGGPAPPIPAAADINGNGEPDVGDVTIIINFIFRYGPRPVCMLD